MSITPKQVITGVAAGLVLAIPTIWLPHGLVRFIAAIAVIVAAVGGLLLAAHRLGLIEDEPPHVEEQEQTAA
jgi:hypothetical protein